MREIGGLWFKYHLANAPGIHVFQSSQHYLSTSQFKLTSSKLQPVIRAVPDREVLGCRDDLQRHGRYLSGVIDPVPDGQTGYAHVRIANRLDFVDVELIDDRIEGRVQIVEKCNYLQRGRHRTENRETDDIGKENRHRIKLFG